MNGAPIPDVAPKIEPTGDIAAEAAKAADVAKARQIGELKRVQAAAEAQEAAQNAENPPLQKEPAIGPATGSLVKDFVGRMESKKTNKVEMPQSNDLPLNEPQNPPVAGPDSGDGESRQPGQEPTVEAGSGEPSAAGSSVEGGQATGGGTPPLSTEVPAQGQAEPTADEKTNNVARELLEKDETAKAYLKTLGITDLENLNVAEEIERLKGKETAGTLTKGEGPLLRRLQEIHGRALRQEAQVKLDEMNKNGEDKNSPAYQEAKQQFEDHAPDEERHYVREAIRQDTGLRKMVQKKYDLEDFDIQQAIHDEGDSRLGKRLQEISDHGHRAVLLDKQEYTKSEDQAGLMNEIAKTGEHERGFGRRGLDKLNDFIEQFSGAEIRNAFNQAKGWKTVMKSNEKLLKNPNLSEDDRKRYKENLENAKKLRAAALNEALGKRGLKILFWIFIALSALMVIGPAVLPAKLMEWGGKGAGGH